MIMRLTELPIKVREVVEAVKKFKEVDVKPCIKCTVGHSWSDYNSVTVTVLDVENNVVQSQRGCNEDTYLNSSRHERAMYSGVEVPIPNPNIWILEFNTYPKSVTIYCHPDAMAKALPTAPPCTRKQQIALFITRSTSSSYRLEEARHFKIGKVEWEQLKQQLYAMGLMTKVGSLTTEGKQAAEGLNFNYWEENKNENL